MEIYTGQVASKGVVIGQIVYFAEEEGGQYKKDTPQIELEKFQEAKKIASLQIAKLEEKTRKEVGEEEALIFQTHQMMLEDLDFLEFIEEKILLDQGAVDGVLEARDYFSSLFLQMEDAYMQARSADIIDISNRILKVLQGKKDQEINQPSIIVASDLTPSQTLQMQRENLLAFVTQEGSLNSHTAILARTMGIPALIQVEISQSMNQKLAIIDCNEGKMILLPDEETLKHYQALLLEQEKQKEALNQFRAKETKTKEGRKIMLYANAGNLEDIQLAVENDAEGIGLLRSEFLYLQKTTYPTEEEQFLFYKQALELMQGKRVVVRTLDIGADKKIDYFNLSEEENPALGYRGIRICLDRLDVFKTQLRALLRASLYGKLAIMFPMIISLWEVQEIKKILEEVKEELLDNHQEFAKEIEIGIMIETPAAALIAEDLAKEVDFFSIGTNDLTQYTLALDRQNQNLHRFGNAYHSSIFRLIAMSIEAGHKHQCWVGVCGEIAGEEEAIKKLLALGLDEFSVSPKAILPIRQMIFQH